MAELARASRQQILETAADLFFRRGFRAVGIDTIVAESGVAKMTLYRHFPSKDDLIVAYLKDSNERFWAWFDDATSRPADSVRDRVITFFTALESLVKTPKCHGCPFLNAVVDFPDCDHPANKVAIEHKRAVRERFRELVAQAGAREPEALADQLLLLMDGAFMAIRMFKAFSADSPAVRVADAAKALIATQLPEA
jgi:AcrR family transcriptional regulator